MSRSIRRRALLAAVLPAALAVCALPPAAHAGVLGLNPSNRNLGYTDTKGETNNVVLRIVGNEIEITDSARIETASTGPCRVFNLTTATCPAASVGQVSVFTGPGNDKVEYRLPHPGFVSLGDGTDRLIAGKRQALGRAIAPATYQGDGGHDTIDYVQADRGVKLNTDDRLANDGRPGDQENVLPDFEVIFGSQFDDTLWGSDLPEQYFGLGGNDIIAGGLGNDIFYSSFNDGADDYHGGPGIDSMEYFGRTKPLLVTLDNAANDGESGERDNVRSNVENIAGGSAGDVFESFGAHSRLDGRGGDDFLFGGGGPDTLIGGPGVDQLHGGDGNDIVDARDGQLDVLDCGPGTDQLMRDGQERRVAGCEQATVGKLSLTPASTTAAAGKTARLKLSWRHPRAWKQLRTIELRLTHDGLPVGTVKISSRGKRIAGTGAVRVLRATKVTTNGKTVAANLALRLDASVAGKTLRAEVEATDARGRRQLERRAATVRVSR